MARSFDELEKQGQLEARQRQEAALKARRASEVAEVEQRDRHQQQERAYKTLTIRASLNAAYYLHWVLGPLAGLIVLLGLAIDVAAAWCSGALMGVLAAASAIWVTLTRRRFIRMIESLPFAVTGLSSALNYGRSYPSCEIEFTFVHEVPSSTQLVTVLNVVNSAQMAKVNAVNGATLSVELHSSVGSKFDGHRRWLARWMRRACAESLLALHERFPLASMHFPT